MEKLPIGIQLYSVRDFLEKDYAGTVKKIGAMGYDTVELACGFYGHTPAELKKIFADAGVDPISAHVGCKVLRADLEQTMSDYAEIGCKFIVIPWAADEDLPGGANYREFLEEIKKFAGCAKKHGMTLLYHNHNFEFTKLENRYLLDILYADTDKDVLATQIDTCWARVGGVDPAQYVMKYAGRAPLVHLKDSAGDKEGATYDLIDGGSQKVIKPENKFELRPAGYGTQDVLAIIKASEVAGALGVIVEQDTPSLDKNSLECAKLSIDYIRNIY